MTLKPDKLTIHELFQRERRYVVPLYQRAYVWGQQGQWEPLWEDIERQAEICLDAEGQGPRRSHFLGAIVLNVSRIVGAGVARSEVIDGQQRLTTLQLLIAALRDFAAETSSRHLSKLKRLTVNEDEKEGSEGSFKVWPTNADRATFREVLTAGSPQALRKSLEIVDRASAPRLAAAYLYFSDRILDFVVAAGDDSELRDQRIFAIYQALRTALQLVVIELEEGDDPQVIFETLNARGQPLLPSDLIRNYIFLNAANDPSCDADELYNRYWRAFDDDRVSQVVNGENRFWHVPERQGRLLRPRIDLFLFHYLTMKTERDLNIGQLFGEFRDWRDSHPQNIEDLLADLKAYSVLFQRLVQPKGDDRASLLAKRLKALDNSTVYPVLLYLMSLPVERLSSVSREAILADIESWLVRRFVCQLTNKNYNRFFVGLVGKIKNAPSDADLVEVVRAELSRSRDVTTRWPLDDEFEAAWLSKPIYTKSRPDRSAMVLRAIEAHIRTTKNEAMTLPDVLSVEHLLPQKGTLADYPYANELPLQTGETAERCRERILHTLGNLTLLTSELNSSVSNGPFAGKTADIAAYSDLRLNAWLRTNPPEAWSETSIVARGGSLFQAARDIWHRPEGEPENIDDEDASPAVKGEWKFSDPVLRQAKRDAVVAGLEARENLKLIVETVAKRRSAEGTVRAVIAISKRYEDRGAFPYWYAYHPDWDAYLAHAERGFLLLGCMDREVGYAIPRDVLLPLLDALNTTTRADTGKSHWHIHLVERNEGLALLLPKTETTLNVEPYRVEMAAAHPQPVTASA
ncbi:hypothetical protein D3C71_921190 [compost metagenome]